MNTSALIMWSVTMLIVGGFCAYFFYGILTAEKKPEPDSYSGNDDKA